VAQFVEMGIPTLMPGSVADATVSGIGTLFDYCQEVF
jgi:hypothetical protein